MCQGHLLDIAIIPKHKPPVKHFSLAHRFLFQPTLYSPAGKSYLLASHTCWQFNLSAGISGFVKNFSSANKILLLYNKHDNRLNRKRYILRGLALIGINIVAALVFGTIGMMIDETFGTILISLIGLAMMVPSIMLLIRRLNDLNRPG